MIVLIIIIVLIIFFAVIAIRKWKRTKQKQQQEQNSLHGGGILSNMIDLRKNEPTSTSLEGISLTQEEYDLIFPICRK